MLPYPTRTNKTGLGFGDYFRNHNVFHPGVDFNWGNGNDDLNQPVTCPTLGVVVYVSPEGTNGGLGNYVVIWHPFHGLWTRYLHLEKVFVRAGEKLVREQLIGLLGDSGTTSAHLHFEVLNEKGLAFIRDHHRPYGGYPVGMPKDRMMQLWIDPEYFLFSAHDPDDLTAEQIRDHLETAQKTILYADPSRQTLLRRLIRKLNRMLKRVREA